MMNRFKSIAGRLGPVTAAILCFSSLAFVAASIAATEKKAQIQTESSLDAMPVSEHAPVFPEVLLKDVVVSNTDPTLVDTDKFYNSEPGIAVNPVNPKKMVISSFSGAWTRSGQTGFRNAPI